jgi:hypothetical protein
MRVRFPDGILIAIACLLGQPLSSCDGPVAESPDPSDLGKTGGSSATPSAAAGTTEATGGRPAAVAGTGGASAATATGGAAGSVATLAGAGSHCLRPTQADSATAHAAYETFKTTLVTSEGASGYLRIYKPDSGTVIGSTVSEGMGYGMLLAVYRDDQDVFDQLWRCT